MRRFLFSVLVIGVTVLGLLGIQPAPVYAFGAGCSAINGATFSTSVNDPFITGPLQFSAGDPLVYSLTWSFASFTPTAVDLEISVNSTVVASAHITNLSNASVAYTFPSDQLATLRFDWTFFGSGTFTGHTITTHISCGLYFSGPPLPAGFVLKTITCNVAVYDAPGGKPVGSNAIKAGQTWYVNPTPKKDAAGKLWTEIFVAGFTNGFVPTNCVH